MRLCNSFQWISILILFAVESGSLIWKHGYWSLKSTLVLFSEHLVAGKRSCHCHRLIICKDIASTLPFSKWGCDRSAQIKPWVADTAAKDAMWLPCLHVHMVEGLGRIELFERVVWAWVSRARRALISGSSWLVQHYGIVGIRSSGLGWYNLFVTCCAWAYKCRCADKLVRLALFRSLVRPFVLDIRVHHFVVLHSDLHVVLSRAQTHIMILTELFAGKIIAIRSVGGNMDFIKRRLSPLVFIRTVCSDLVLVLSGLAWGAVKHESSVLARFESMEYRKRSFQDLGCFRMVDFFSLQFEPSMQDAQLGVRRELSIFL